eukprot:1177851-Prorocentrum_minimum.AAC.2
MSDRIAAWLWARARAFARRKSFHQGRLGVVEGDFRAVKGGFRARWRTRGEWIRGRRGWIQGQGQKGGIQGQKGLIQGRGGWIQDQVKVEFRARWRVDSGSGKGSIQGQ